MRGIYVLVTSNYYYESTLFQAFYSLHDVGSCDPFVYKYICLNIHQVTSSLNQNQKGSRRNLVPFKEVEKSSAVVPSTATVTSTAGHRQQDTNGLTLQPVTGSSTTHTTSPASKHMTHHQSSSSTLPSPRRRKEMMRELIKMEQQHLEQQQDEQ